MPTDYDELTRNDTANLPRSEPTRYDRRDPARPFTHDEKPIGMERRKPITPGAFSFTEQRRWAEKAHAKACGEGMADTLRKLEDTILSSPNILCPQCRAFPGACLEHNGEAAVREGPAREVRSGPMPSPATAAILRRVLHPEPPESEWCKVCTVWPCACQADPVRLVDGNGECVESDTIPSDVSPRADEILVVHLGDTRCYRLTNLTDSKTGLRIALPADAEDAALKRAGFVR